MAALSVDAPLSDSLALVNASRRVSSLSAPPDDMIDLASRASSEAAAVGAPEAGAQSDVERYAQYSESSESHASFRPASWACRLAP